MSDLSRMYDEKVLCEKALTRLRAQLDEAQFALRGAYPLVKAMVMSAQLNGTGLEASYQPVLDAIAVALATLDVPTPKEQLWWPI